MKLVEHPYDPGREEPLEVLHTAGTRGLVVVMGQFTGRTFPDFFVATYFEDGTKATGACMSTRSRDLALAELLNTSRMWADRADEARALLRKHEAAA